MNLNRQRQNPIRRLLPFYIRPEYPLDPVPVPPAPTPVPTPSNNGEKVYNQFVARYGARQWDSTVEQIQRWYYGGAFVKDNWCATSMSYMCDQAGCLNRIGGKNENVYDMMIACQAAAAANLGTFYTKAQLPATIPQYAVCFWLWSGTTMTSTSSKHVNLSELDNGDGTLTCIGGNQSNQIRSSTYDKSRLYAIYVIGG